MKASNSGRLERCEGSARTVGRRGKQASRGSGKRPGRASGMPADQRSVNAGRGPVDRLESMIPPPVDDSILDPYASPANQRGSLAGDEAGGGNVPLDLGVADKKRKKKERKRRKKQEREEIQSKDRRTQVDRPAGAAQESDATEKVSIGRRIGAAVASLVAWVVVLGLLGAMGYFGYRYWRTTMKHEHKAQQKASKSSTVRVTLSITSRPTGALIIVNGKGTGLRTPNDLLVDTPSPVLVELRKKGYPIWVDHVPVGSGETVPIAADLRHPPGMGLGGPRGKGARGSVHDDRGRKRHRRVRREGSRRNLSRMDGAGHGVDRRTSSGGGGRANRRDDEVRGRTIQPGQDSLAAQVATIEIAASRRAWVYINGRRIDYTKLVKRVMPGTYRIWVRVGTMRSRTKVVQVRAGQVRRLYFNLNE